MCRVCALDPATDGGCTRVSGVHVCVVGFGGGECVGEIACEICVVVRVSVAEGLF